MSIAVSDAEEHLETSNHPRVQRNAHAKPEAPPSQALLAETARREDDLVARPGLAPVFEWDALRAVRKRHARDIVRATGPSLGLGRRLDRLLAVQRPFMLYHSGWPPSGAPHPFA